jgi:predicted transposase
MERFIYACNRISEEAFHDRCLGKFQLQKKVYRGIREDFGLSAQLTIRAVSKVVESYKTDLANI